MLASVESPYFNAWVDSSEADLSLGRDAILTKDFEALATVAEASCLKMHGLMLATPPGLMYWRGPTLECLHRIRRLRAAGTGVFFTVDCRSASEGCVLTGCCQRRARSIGRCVRRYPDLGLGVGRGSRSLLSGRVVVSAPGKMVILGEYAVLDGAPCLVAAVNRRATVTLRFSTRLSGVLTALMPDERRFELWAGKPSGLALVDQVRDASGLSHLVVDGRLDTRPCFDLTSGEKLGIGSSAALSCALWAALNALADPGAALDLAALDRLRVGLQGGGGSGVDLAASFLGGCQRFQRLGDDTPDCKAVGWPAGVEFVAVFFGPGCGHGGFCESVPGLVSRHGGRRSRVTGAHGQPVRSGAARRRSPGAGRLSSAHSMITVP